MELGQKIDGFCDNVIVIGSSERDRELNVVDEVADSKRSRSVKRTDLQLKMLKSFMMSHPDFTQGQADEKLLLAWDNLAVQLNSIGPPIHSSVGWRKNWSDYKASLKRKRSSESANVSPVEDLIVDANLREADNRDAVLSDSTLKSDETLHSLYYGILKKLDVVVEQQIRTNDLLERLILIFETQVVDSDVHSS